jgi:hypothetical protein
MRRQLLLGSALSMILALSISAANAANSGSQFSNDNSGDPGSAHATSTTGEGLAGMGAGVTTSPTLPQNEATSNAPTAPSPGFNALGGMVLNPTNSVIGGGTNQHTLAGVYGYGNGQHNGLPATTMDSFVMNSVLNGTSFMVYGDEGSGNANDGFGGLPPLSNFTYADRIERGIWGSTAQGLTTGHSSYLPSATGYDEFIAPPGEWYQSSPGAGSQLNTNVPGFSISIPGVPVPITIP